MSGPAEAVARLAASGEAAVLVEVAGVAGSTPREAGAWMIVTAGGGMVGTVGGGRLELLALERALALIGAGGAADALEVPLGPDIGQCCGGRVRLSLSRLDAAGYDRLARRLAGEAAARPHVLVFGAGHVGRALAAALALVPVRPVLVDPRREALDEAPDGVERRLAAIPEAELAAVPDGTAAAIVSHDHGLDFAIARRALEHGGLAYVGMIGSATKRAVFERWLAAEAPGLDAARLTCPIGGGTADKRPEVIAALATAEILTALAAPARRRSASGSGPP